MQPRTSYHCHECPANIDSISTVQSSAEVARHFRDLHNNATSTYSVCAECALMTSHTASAFQHSVQHDQIPPSFSSVGRLASIICDRRTSTHPVRGVYDEVNFNYLDKTEKHIFSFTVNKKFSHVRLDCLVLALANLSTHSETSLLPYPWNWKYNRTTALSPVDQLGLLITKGSHEVWVPMDDARSMLVAWGVGEGGEMVELWRSGVPDARPLYHRRLSCSSCLLPILRDLEAI